MKKRIKYYIFIFIISIIVSIPLFSKDFDIYGDDGIQHICRLMGTYQSIDEGQIFPVIMSKFCNGFGYSWNLFYSPITAYVPLLFKIFTESFVVTLKLFMFLVTFLSGISMFELLKRITKNSYTGILGATIYMLAPYRLTDMYMRMAIAELTSFIFLPMVFHGIYNIFDEEREKRSGVLLTVGAAGLILTHIIIAMYTAIFGAVYVLINIKKLKNKEILKKLLLNLLLILCITSFYIVPLLEHRMNTQYEVFAEDRMIREEALIYNKVEFKDLFYTPQNQLISEIGLVTLVGVLLSILAIKKIDHKYKKIYIFSIFAGIISIIMAMKFFPFEKLPTILKMLQFSFRMLEFSSFFLSIVAAINYTVVIKNFNLKDVTVLSLLAILLIVPLKKSLNYRPNANEFGLWPAVEVNENTGRVHAGCATFEYLPSKAFNNLDYINTREDSTYIIEGNAKILKEEKDGTNLTVKFIDLDKNTVFELPYIYYLGYEVKLEHNEEVQELEYSESDKGFIAIKINEDVKEGKIVVSYVGTNLMKISAVVSIIGFTFMIIYVCILYKRRNAN